MTTCYMYYMTTCQGCVVKTRPKLAGKFHCIQGSLKWETIEVPEYNHYEIIISNHAVFHILAIPKHGFIKF
ncbi:hypothetical protein LSH36_977g02022 [Paralvinella palmiformis]|uniref:Uncharacterized protein n=1 Tax=Paralvinella palmiformis TaxID=53620 RepID=A0AAD9IWL2_9ANNE|nr:hypothetical protein LSH36_977g02022 [Paralvinella palmiformis]